MKRTIFSELEVPEVKKALQDNGLVATHVAWEDVARTKNSCWGPNISDVTLKAHYEGRCTGGIDCLGVEPDEDVSMPMIRAPNFRDVTRDVPIDKFMAWPAGADAPMTLSALLSNPALLGANLRVAGSLYSAANDKHVLMQTQACLLRPMIGAEVEFVPKLYNYQSRDDESGVLVLVISSMGVSAFLPGSGTMRLMHNAGGKECWLKATALSALRADATLDNLTPQEQLENTLLVVQVPLVVPERRREPTFSMWLECASVGPSACVRGPPATLGGFDAAKVSAGRETGKQHAGLDSAGRQTLRRDERYPIRVVVQHYYVAQRAPTPAEICAVANRMRAYDKIMVAHGSLVNDESARTTDPANRNWGHRGMIAME